MATQRYEHTATLLTNGKVLVAGGNNFHYGPAITELYDPASGTWTTTGALKTPRYGHTATLLRDGKVLAVGGLNQYILSPTNGAELYDPVSGTWTTTGHLSTGRYLHSATLLPNGKVLVAGGEGTNFLGTIFAELYDPATGTWTDTGPLNVEHELHPANLLPNGKVLVTGGQFGGGNAAYELYDPATGSWVFSYTLPYSYWHTATLLANGKVLASGGISTNGLTSRQVLYDVGLGFSASWQPQISTFTSPLNLNNSLALTGSKFRGVSEASGSNGSQDSPSDYPVVQLLSLHSEQTLFLPSTSWQTNSFISAPVTNFPPGYALVTVFVNGIPSASSIVRIAATPTTIFQTNAKKLPGGAFQFGFTNTPGAVFTALAATNVSLPLSNWTALTGVIEISSGQFQFTDTQATNSSRRFYRVRSP
jgi:hypothetical protein